MDYRRVGSGAMLRAIAFGLVGYLIGDVIALRGAS
jgi:hypothetical protein